MSVLSEGHFNKIDSLGKENTEIKVAVENQRKIIERIEANKYMEENRFLLMLGQVAYDIDDNVIEFVWATLICLLCILAAAFTDFTLLVIISS